MLALERQLLTRAARGDAALVEELLDDAFEEIGASGRHWTRAETLLLLRDEQRASDIVAGELRAAVVGPGVVIVTWVSDADGRRARRSSLWRLAGGRWRLRFHQGTLLP